MSRRRKKRDPEQHSSWRIIGALGVLTVVVLATSAGMDWLRDPHTMPLRSVQIEGEFRQLGAKQLQQVVANYVNGGFFNVDVKAIRTAVEALPWVYRAYVRRVWPDTVRVRVEEQMPLARWSDEGLVNPAGEFFAPPRESLPAGLPLLAGPERLRESVVRQYLLMEKAATGVGRNVTRLIQDPRRAWTMDWDNGVRLKLGRSDPYPRFLRFLRVYPDLLAANRSVMETVDLRYGNGFAVQWVQQNLEEPEQPG